MQPERKARALAWRAAVGSLLAGMLVAAGTTLPAAEDTAGKPEAKPGLAYFAQKVRDKQPVVIGYLGGSITVGSGSSKYENNYYWVSRSALAKAVAAAGGSLKSENAGIGGTGSEFGAYRVGAQLLAKQPDLLVIEFAVNDGANPNAAEGMEGIVRQALRQNPRIGIVFLYTTSAKYEADFYAQGKLPPSVELHHKVAQHYGIPEVNAGPAVHQALTEGKFTVKECFPDGTHPSDIGHGIYGKLLGETLVAALALPAPAGDPALPALLGGGRYEYACLTPVHPQPLPEGWMVNAKQWNWHGVETLKCETAGKPLKFTAQGEQITLVFLGHLSVRWKTAEGEKTQKLNGRYGMPFPASWRLEPGDFPAGTDITVEAVADDAGKVKAELWGYFAVRKPGGDAK